MYRGAPGRVPALAHDSFPRRAMALLLSMALIVVMVGIVPAVVAPSTLPSALAATPSGLTAYTCTVSTTWVSSGSPTTLYSEKQVSGGGSFTAVGATSSYIYNAMAYSAADGVLYAIGASNETYAGHLLAIDANTGAVKDLGAITGSSAFTNDATATSGTPGGMNAGFFDASGNYWVSNQSSPLGSGTWYEVNTSTHTVVKTVTPSSTAYLSNDWTYANGYAWGIANSDPTVMLRLNLATGAITTFNISSLALPSGTYGAAWTFGNGNLGFDLNGGGYYQIAVANPASSSPTFTLVSKGTGPASNNNDGAGCISPPADLSMTKTAPSYVVQNNTLTWTLTVTNNGAGISSGFTVSDPIPSGVGTATTSTAGCSVTNAVLTCIEGTLAVGASFTITLSAPATAAVGTTIVNTATVIGNESDPTGSNDTSTASTTVGAAPVITLRKVVSGRFASSDQFTVAIANGGTSVASASTTGSGTSATTGAQTVTAGTTYTLSDSTTGTASNYASTLSCTNTNTSSTTTLPSGTTTSATVTPQLNDNITCTYTNTALVPNINITKTAGSVSGPDANGNYTVTYTVTATNSGNGAGTYGPISDTPQFATNLVPTSASWSGAQSGSQSLSGTSTPAYGFTMGTSRTLAAGATDTYAVSVVFHYLNRSPASACNGPGTGTYNSVSASGETGSTSDNAACVAPPSLPSEALTVTKSASPSTYSAVGQTVTYSFVVTNTGAVTLTGVGVADTFTNSPAGNGAMSAISCASTTLAPGAATTCTATYKTTQADLDAGHVSNSATATGTPADTGTPITSSPATATITSTAASSIQLTKTAGTPTDVNKDGLVDAGDTVVYTFVVTNSGSVTLNRPSGGWNADAKIGAANINCPGTATSLAPGASITCTSNAYTITAADVASGAVTNSATATGNPADGSTPVTSTSTATVPTTTPAPAVTVTKAASQSTYQLGDLVAYVFTVTNSGNVPLSKVGVTDAFSAGGTGTAGQIQCKATTLAVGDSTTCTGYYSVNQADVDNGAITDRGTVTGTSPDGVVVTSTSNPVTITDTAAPSVGLQKRVAQVTDVNGDGVTDAGDTISWTFTVTNTGNVTLTAPASGWVSDSMLGAGAVSCTSGGAAVTSLAPGAFVLCTATAYTITSADEAAGSVQNSATASGTAPGGGTVTSTPSTTSTPTNTPVTGLSLTKTVSDAAPGGNGDGTAQAGETLTYTFVVTNTGNVAMDGVSVSEDSFSGAGSVTGISCPQGSLAAGASMTCTASYLVTQADVDAANAASNDHLVNTAHATGTPAGSNTPQDSNEATATIATPGDASLSIKKSVTDAGSGNGDGKAEVGEVLTYSYVVTNTGSLTLTNGFGTDGFTSGGYGVEGDLNCPTLTLEPGQTETCTMPYTVAPADMDATTLANWAFASGTTPAGVTVNSPQDTASIPTAAAPAMSVVKRVARVRDDNADGITDAGDTITWTIAVSNTGDTDLTNVAVNDPMLSSAGVAVTCPQTSLAAGTSMTCSTGTYTITTADQSAGTVANVATASATYPGAPGSPVDAGPTEADTPVATPAPAISVTKTPSQTTYQLGDVITYTFHVTNSGNVTLNGVGVADTFTTGGSGTASAITCGATTLAAGASTDCTMTYTVTQTDVDQGTIANSATASGTPPVNPDGSTGTPVSSTPATATVTDDAQPSLTIAKTVDMSQYVDANHDGLVDAGDTVVWDFSITNDSVVTVYDYNVYDPMLASVPGMRLNCPSAADGTWNLAPGQTSLCYSSAYTLTTSEQAAGQSVNTAAAQGYTLATTDPATDYVSTTPPVQSAPSTAVVPMQAPTPSIEVTKSASQSTFTTSDTITYSFHVVNTGNVPLTGVGVTDTFTTGGSGTASAITCPDTTLAVGGAMDCSMTYAPNQADADLGSVVNQATATGTAPSGDSVTSAPSTATITDAPQPQVTLVKAVDMSQWADRNNDGLVDEGDTIVFTFTVANPGNVTLTGLTIDDPMLAGDGIAITCPVSTLAPGASTECTSAPHPITADDEAAGIVTNTATVSGTPPSGAPVTSTPSSTSTPVQTPDPLLSIVKTADASTFVAGQTVTYSFVVTNEGNVAMSDVSVTDAFGTGGTGTIGAVTCPATSLAVGASMTCTMTYVANQADVDAGAITNTATATGTPPDGTPVSAASTPVTLTDTAAPALTLQKTAHTPVDVNSDGLVDAGDTIAYDFLVTNTGNVTMSGVTIDDPMLSAARNPAVTITCDATVLAPQAATTCHASAYTITAADVANGSVVNTATASATPPGTTTPVTTQPSSVTTPTTTPTPALTLTKAVSDASGDGVATAGETLTYTFGVTNSGNVPLTGLAITDTFTTGGHGTMSAITCDATDLAVGAATTCRATYVVNQADVDAGSVANSATASATTPSGDGGTVTSPPATASIPTPTTSSISLVKGVSAQVDVNGDGLTDAGDTLTYTFHVTNTGAVTLTAVTVDDPMLTAAGLTVTCPAGPLAPGDSVDCTTSPYTITDSDVSAGSVVNSATASGTPPSGTPVTSTPSQVTTPTTAPAPHISVVKSADTTTFTAGQTVTYSFVVTNDGNVPLTGVSVADTFTPAVSGAAGSVDCPSTSLDVGASMTCSMTYVTDQADVDRGSVLNTATATGTPPTGADVTSAPSTVTITDAATPTLTLVKSASTPVDTNADGLVDAGDTMTFSFTITNDGNVTVSGLAVDDAMLAAAGATIGCDATTLAPGESTTCRSTTYTITAGDVAHGSVDNTATASGTTPGGGTVTSNESGTSTPTTTPAPAITLVKSVVDTTTNAATAKVGDTLTYTFRVTNSGNVPLSGISIADTFTTGGSGGLPAITCPAAPLPAGQSVDCTASYVVTQADVDAGSIVNSATASATPPTGDGGTVTSTPSTASIPTPTDSSLSLTKSASTPVDVNGDGLVDAGDTMTFSFLVTNTGSVTLSNLAISDPMLTTAGVALDCKVTSLAPQAQTTCTSGTYTITSSDVGNGAVSNVATASATPPGSTTPVGSNDSTTTTPTTTPAPSLSLTKAVADASGDGIATLGERLTYTFVVTNNGNVPVTGVAITDSFTTGARTTLSGITCEATTLAAAASTQCTGSYTVTQADVDAGHIDNAATASGTPTGQTSPVTSPEATATIPTPNDASLSLVKSVADETGATSAKLGDTLDYTFVVTNTGSVTLSGITIADSFTTGGSGTLSAITCDDTALAPAASTNCHATYTVTQADVDAGTVANSATASGTTPGGGTATSQPSTASIPTDQQPALSLVKKAGTPTDTNGDGLTDAGDTIVYTFSVTNTGTVTMSDVAIVDAKLAAAGVTIGCTDTVLAPQASTTCTSSAYTISADDVTSGVVHNSATAEGTPPGSSTPTSSTASTTDTPTTAPSPAIALVKSVASEAGRSDLTAGDTLDYTFTVTNTGNVPLSDVSVSDTWAQAVGGTLSAISCPTAPLAVGASVDCTATYTVTQADVDTGILKNTATATATPPSGDGPSVTSPPADAQFPGNPAPSLDLVKKAGTPTDTNGDGLVDAGDTIVYTFTVTNTGNVTMSNVAVTDDKLAAAGVTITCDATQLAPAASATCTSTAYEITAGDVSAGVVHNSATAQGTPPGSTTPISSTPSTTDTPTTAPAPRLALVKTVTDASGDSVVQANETLTYTFTITNTGNVPVQGLSIADAFTRGGSGILSAITCPAAPLAVGDSTTCTATYVADQADVDAGGVTNSATASGVPVGGTGTVTSNTSSADIPANGAPAIQLVKNATLADTNGNGVADKGEVITYTFTVTNTGTVTLYNPTVTDPLVGLTDATCAAGALAPGDSVTCSTTATHTVSQADVDAGHVKNTATATADDKNPATTDPTSSSSTDTPTTQASGLDLVKDVNTSSWADVNSDGLWDAGDTYVYTFTVTNTGSVTLHGIGVDDPMLAAAGVGVTCKATTLLPAASTTCTSGAYTVTASDEKAGKVDNTATATGTTPSGTTTTSTPSSKEVPLVAPDPSLVLTKSVRDTTSGTATAQLGDQLVYTFTLTNNGNVTLTGPGVSDAMLSSAGVAITCPSGALAPGAAATCTSGAYTVTRADITAGQVANTATAHATPPSGTSTTSNPSSATVSTADIGLLKSARSVTDTNGDGLTDAGDQVVWQFMVTNSGQQPLTDVTVVDKTLAARGVTITCPQSTLGVGESQTCVSSAYTITAADQTAGLVHNVATARGTTVGGSTSASPTASPTASASDSGSATPTGTPSASDSSSATPSASDSSTPSASASGPTATPSSTATGGSGGDLVVSPPSTWDVPVQTPAPALSLTKTVSDANGDGKGELGERLTYHFLVTNTGNVPLQGVAVSDPMFSAVDCPQSTLGVGASMTCTATWTVTQANVDAGKVHNTATAHGTVPGSPDVPVVSPPSTVTIAVPGTPAISLVKSARLIDTNGNKGADAGEKIVYTFRITNTGTVTLTDIMLADPRLDGVKATYTWPTGAHTLVPGASMTVTASAYTVTAADAAASAIVNTATTTGTPPSGGPVSDTATATVPVAPTTTRASAPTPTPTPTSTPTSTPTQTPTRPATTVSSPVPGASVPPSTTTPQSGRLPNTGSDVAPWQLGVGVLASLLGVALLIAGRRRPRG